jgi:hypothetical protein
VARQVIVVGRSRSGTSLTAGLLHLMGVNMHPSNIQDFSNPKGAFEDAEFIRITMNMELAIKTGDEELMQKYLKRSLELVAQYDSECSIWGFKSAIVHLVIEHLLPLMSAPGIVYVFRNPLDTALSEAKFTHGDSALEYTEKLKEAKISTGIRGSADFLFHCERIMNQFKHIPHCYVTFEKLRSCPNAVAYELASFLGVNLNDEQYEKIKEFVMPDYCSWRQK